MDCKEGNQKLIDTLKEVLEQIREEQYKTPLEIFNGSSIGQHTRHIYDFYACFLKGMRKDCIDYSKRERNHRIESEPGYAVTAFGEIQREIDRIEDQNVNVLSDFSAELSESRMVVRSSINRELMFVHDHAVHHLAILRIGLSAAFPELALEQGFGVAPSTIRYQVNAGN